MKNSVFWGALAALFVLPSASDGMTQAEQDAVTKRASIIPICARKAILSVMPRQGTATTDLYDEQTSGAEGRWIGPKGESQTARIESDLQGYARLSADYDQFEIRENNKSVRIASGRQVTKVNMSPTSFRDSASKISGDPAGKQELLTWRLLQLQENYGQCLQQSGAWKPNQYPTLTL